VAFSARAARVGLFDAAGDLEREVERINFAQ
jgi:hypothetical protein